MILLDAGASKEVPFVLEADGSSDSPDEAQPYVYPPHLDGLRTHGDEVDVASILAVAELQWPTSAFVGVIGFSFLAIGLSIFGWASYVDSVPVESMESLNPFQVLLFVVPVAYVFATLLCRATVGIMINRCYYAKGPEWDVSLGPQPKKNSPAFELMACLIFCLGTVAAYFYLKGVPGADDWEPALTDLLILLPWITVGAIVIDGYHIPQIQRSLGLL